MERAHRQREEDYRLHRSERLCHHETLAAILETPVVPMTSRIRLSLHLGSQHDRDDWADLSYGQLIDAHAQAHTDVRVTLNTNQPQHPLVDRDYDVSRAVVRWATCHVEEAQRLGVWDPATTTPDLRNVRREDDRPTRSAWRLATLDDDTGVRVGRSRGTIHDLEVTHVPTGVVLVVSVWDDQPAGLGHLRRQMLAVLRSRTDLEELP